jgi:hypothetical protein
MHKGLQELQDARTTFQDILDHHENELHGDVLRRLQKIVEELGNATKQIKQDEDLQNLHERVEARGKSPLTFGPKRHSR